MSARVQGASTGLGRAFASVVARGGGKLSIVSKNEQRLRAACDELQAASRQHKVFARAADVGNASELANVRECASVCVCTLSMYSFLSCSLFVFCFLFLFLFFFFVDCERHWVRRRP